MDVLKPGIVRGDDRQVRQIAADLAHLVAAHLGPVAAGAKQANQPLGMVLPQGGEDVLHAHGVVGVVQQQGVVAGDGHRFHPALDLHRGQALLHGLHRDAQLVAGANGRQGVVGVEPAGDIHLGGEVLLPGHLKGQPQEPGTVQVAAIRPPQVCGMVESVGLHLAGVAL